MKPAFDKLTQEAKQERVSFKAFLEVMSSKRITKQERRDEILKQQKEQTQEECSPTTPLPSVEDSGSSAPAMSTTTIQGVKIGDDDLDEQAGSNGDVQGKDVLGEIAEELGFLERPRRGTRNARATAPPNTPGDWTPLIRGPAYCEENTSESEYIRSGTQTPMGAMALNSMAMPTQTANMMPIPTPTNLFSQPPSGVQTPISRQPHLHPADLPIRAPLCNQPPSGGQTPARGFIPTRALGPASGTLSPAMTDKSKRSSSKSGPRQVRLNFSRSECRRVQQRQNFDARLQRALSGKTWIQAQASSPVKVDEDQSSGDLSIASTDGRKWIPTAEDLEKSWNQLSTACGSLAGQLRDALPLPSFSGITWRRDGCGAVRPAPFYGGRVHSPRTGPCRGIFLRSSWLGSCKVQDSLDPTK
eukprot:TRINITY_DN1270_c0_g1_i3.p1 TRINITY_DN1270_c0_g1~~TRINITY_DN1270_c0_g1_i3.p1  ORF type:complete len:439 (+),score=70.03 TRINITY_DN1270_c0_g1_i3:74-1318(+)